MSQANESEADEMRPEYEEENSLASHDPAMDALVARSADPADWSTTGREGGAPPGGSLYIRGEAGNMRQSLGPFLRSRSVPHPAFGGRAEATAGVDFAGECVSTHRITPRDSPGWIAPTPTTRLASTLPC